MNLCDQRGVLLVLKANQFILEARAGQSGTQLVPPLADDKVRLGSVFEVFPDGSKFGG